MKNKSKRPSSKRALIPAAPVEGLIRIIRDQKVMLDSDLAGLYGVSTKVLNQAVRRNWERFPNDFMFKLTLAEANIMRSQTVTASKRNIKYQSFAFTEHGIAMLSSVLRSPQAIQMNIMIIRAFMRLREIMATHKDLAARIEKLERSHDRTGSVIEILVEDIDKLSREIRQMKNPPEKPKRRIGFCIPYD